MPDANLALVAVATNDTRKAKTRSEGNYTFVNLPIGVYKLTAAKPGYETTLQPSVVVQAAQTTDLRLTLKVGKASETVTVDSSATTLLETTQNSLVTVIDPKFVEDLPLIDRDISYFSTLVPGYAGVPGASAQGNGSWNGKITMDGGSDIDGVMQSPTRFKGQGTIGSGVTARLENVAEMAVQSDQIDVDQGFGQNSMQVSFVSRSGTNQFHGRAFTDVQNAGFNANAWTNDAQVPAIRKDKLIYVDWGISGGGPIWKDKLFFYGTFATRTIPGTYTQSAQTLSASAQAGNFSYVYNGTTYTQNVYAMAAAAGVTLNTAPDGAVASQIAHINTNYIPAGTIHPIQNDANVNTLDWHETSPQRFYYPLARLDYNINSRLRTSLSWTMTHYNAPHAYGPLLPGEPPVGQLGNSFIASYRLDWDLSPAITNEYRLGFNYNYSNPSEGVTNQYITSPNIFWGLGASGQNGYFVPQSNSYPVFNMSDTVSLQKKAHTIKFGFSGYREQDHYWNPPGGEWYVSLGLSNSNDPAYGVFTQATLPNATPGQVGEAQALYGTLTGRVNSITSGPSGFALNPSTGQYNKTISAYNLDEVSLAWGLYAQDSWKLSSSLTLNYGMRWDFTGDNHDLTGAYHSADPTSIYGPTPVGDLFHPGDLSGNQNPEWSTPGRAYQPWYISPQPQVGFAWNPHADSGLWQKILGGSDTVIRTGISLKRFTEPYQSYWIWASDGGAFFFDGFSYNSGKNGTQPQGFFAPGSLTLANASANYPSRALTNNFSTTLQSYQKTIPESQLTYLNSPQIQGMDPKIAQPEVISWNYGIQRKLGATRAIEVRYVANRSYHQWLAVNTNEVNIFENGFLSEFKLAQANQLINYNNQKGTNPGQTLETTSYANLGYAGQQNLPIIATAFWGETPSGAGASTNQSSDYTNTQYTEAVAHGAAGTFASQLANNQGQVYPYCNLVGASFTPCTQNFGLTVGAAGGFGPGTLPINFFQANPYSGGLSTNYLTDSGYSNYESMQMEFRQQQWRGLQIEANYTLSHTLGNGGGAGQSGGPYTQSQPIMTLHDPRLNYRPAAFDIRHVLHANGVYDLPIGRGKPWLNDNKVVSRVIGNWIVGSIVTVQTGTPTQVLGGYQTYNDFADGGVTFANGMTKAKLQHAVGVYRLPKSAVNNNASNGIANYVLTINPKYLTSPTVGGANSAYIQPNTTPGTFGAIPYLYGPHGFYQDMSLSKAFPIFRETRVKFQAEIHNVWNHPVFGNTGGLGDVGVLDTNSFGQNGGPSNSARAMDMRLNIDF